MTEKIEEENKQYSTMKAVIGAALVLMSSVSFLLAKYGIKIMSVSPADVVLLSAILQGIVFSFVVLACSKESPVSWAYKENGAINGRALGILIMLILSHGIIQICILVGARHIPVSLVAVLTSTTPISSLILSRIWVKTKVSLFKISLCISLVLGVLLVVEPELEGVCFSSERHENNVYNGSTDLTVTLARTYTMEDYIIGISSCLIFFIFSGVVLVTPGQLPQASTNVIMLWSSLGKLTVSGILVLLKVQSEIFDRFLTISWERWLVISAIAVCMLLVSFLIISGLKLGTPAYIAAMIRRIDIVVVLLIDCIFFQLNPIALQWAGAGLVFLSISLINFADMIEKRLADLKQERKLITGKM